MRSFFVGDSEGEGGIGSVDGFGVSVRTHVDDVRVVSTVTFGAYDAKYFVRVGSRSLSSLDSDVRSWRKGGRVSRAASGGGSGGFAVCDGIFDLGEEVEFVL